MIMAFVIKNWGKKSWQMDNVKLKNKTWQMFKHENKAIIKIQSQCGNKNISICKWVLLRTNVPKYQIMLKHSLIQHKIKQMYICKNKCVYVHQG